MVGEVDFGDFADVVDFGPDELEEPSRGVLFAGNEALRA